MNVEETRQQLTQVSTQRVAAELTSSSEAAELRAAVAKYEALLNELPRDVGGKLADDKVTWDRLEANERQALEARISGLLAAFHRLARSDEPSDPGNIMFSKHASNGWIRALLAFGILGIGVVMWFIVDHWPQCVEQKGSAAVAKALERRQQATLLRKQAEEEFGKLDGAETRPAPPTVQEKRTAEDHAVLEHFHLAEEQCVVVPGEKNVLLMVGLMGALGGLIHFIGSLAMYVGAGRLMRRWLIYYFVLPFQGAALALIVYLLLRVGLLAPTANNGGGTSQINLVAIYAFAGLTGMFARPAADKLAEIFQTMFRTARTEEKDKLSANGSPPPAKT